MKVNTIYNGDAYELIKQIPDKSIDLIVTDPPYEWKKGGEMTGLFRKGVSSRNFMDSIEKMKMDKGINFDILNDFVRVMKKINIYIWCNKEQLYTYMKYFVEKYKCYFEIIIWNKTNVTPLCGNKYLTDKEYCLFFREKGVKILGQFETKKTVYTTSINIEDKKKFGHPTIKPLSIIENLIKNSSVEGGVVLDPFVGSGTTCVAAKRLGRKYIGFEINEKYYKIAKDRLQGWNQKNEMNLFDI